MGWQNLFHCEIQEFLRKVLQYWFPNSESYEDITKTDFHQWQGKVDVLTGGFPCQPFSLAGRRKGADDNRYLWPQMLRAIRQIHPTWVVGENVNGIKTMVESCQVTQMGRSDYLFEENHLYREESRFTLDKICADLEAEGYSVQPLVIPACAIGAPHRRDRVWIIAHRSDPRAETVQQEGQDGICSARPSTHTQCDGHSPQGHGNQRARAKKSKKRKNRPQSRSRRHGSGKTSTYTLQHRRHEVHQDPHPGTNLCSISTLSVNNGSHRRVELTIHLLHSAIHPESLLLIQPLQFLRLCHPMKSYILLARIETLRRRNNVTLIIIGNKVVQLSVILGILVFILLAIIKAKLVCVITIPPQLSSRNFVFNDTVFAFQSV
ncbi:DNA cytosine methyltransferase [Segatella hominis]|uniref:DNA cytosine methyltransferase n=1 Tax=Segatella hominis TaxID=2518605 RepID=UPI003F7D4E1A